MRNRVTTCKHKRKSEASYEVFAHAGKEETEKERIMDVVGYEESNAADRLRCDERKKRGG